MYSFETKGTWFTDGSGNAVDIDDVPGDDYFNDTVTVRIRGIGGAGSDPTLDCKNDSEEGLLKSVEVVPEKGKSKGNGKSDSEEGVVVTPELRRCRCDCDGRNCARCAFKGKGKGG